MAQARSTNSESGTYHVTARGNGRQILFEEDVDYLTFLSYLSDALAQSELSLLAWCLMDNHVHLLLRGPRLEVSQMMHSVLGKYAMHFNRRTGHVGHVFQNRFACKEIASEEHLYEAIRYIHQNPAKAGLGTTEGYRWSSFHEYAEQRGLCDTETVLELAGGINGFRMLCESRQGAYVEPGRRFPEERNLELITQSVLNGISPLEIKTLPKPARNEALRKLRESGLGVRQIERLTGVGRSVISRVCR